MALELSEKGYCDILAGSEDLVLHFLMKLTYKMNSPHSNLIQQKDIMVVFTLRQLNYTINSDTTVNTMSLILCFSFQLRSIVRTI